MTSRPYRAGLGNGVHQEIHEGFTSGSLDVVAATETADQSFPQGPRVRHAEWGPGVVHHYERDLVVILFDSEGYRSLGFDLVAANGLLQAAD